MISKKGAVSLVVGTVLLMLIIAMSIVHAVRSTRRDTERFAAIALRRLSADWDYATFVAMATDEFASVYSRAQWEAKLQASHERLGRYQSHRSLAWKADTYATSGGSGTTRIELTWRVSFERAERDIQMVLLRGSGPRWLIDWLEMQVPEQEGASQE